jgi:hypothetical protein
VTADHAPGEDAAAKAFEALHAEVLQLRVELAAMATARDDYAPTLGAMMQTLAAIEDHPALRLEPQRLASELKGAVEGVQHRARAEIDVTTRRLESAAFNLERLVGRTRSTVDQRRRTCTMFGVGVVLGGIIWAAGSGPIARGLPSAWHVPERMAAATLRDDRWSAGQRLMESVDPKAWARVLDAAAFERANRVALERCALRAMGRREAQRCVVEVSSSSDFRASRFATEGQVGKSE